MADVRISGGCQCGAVRYALHAQPSDPHICHCRMCQKAFGNFFAALAGVPKTAFEVTRGEMALFRSSDNTDRGFCQDCGTPLSFAYRDSKTISVSIGSLDDPAKIQPRIQYGTEARMPWFAALADMPGRATEDDIPAPTASAIRGSNHQHPDHDTTVWPPKA